MPSLLQKTALCFIAVIIASPSFALGETVEDENPPQTAEQQEAIVPPAEPIAPDTLMPKANQALETKQEEEEASEKNQMLGEPLKEEDETKEKTKSEEEEAIGAEEPEYQARKKSRMRFLLFAAFAKPFSDGAKMHYGLGGVIGYDLYDRYGFELFISQVWGEADFMQRKGLDTSLLTAKPGVRIKILNGLYRPYVAAHAGLAQGQWQQEIDGDTRYFTNVGADAQLGMEFLIGNLFLIDIMALYEMAKDVMPSSHNAQRRRTSNEGYYHALFFAIGFGVSTGI